MEGIIPIKPFLNILVTWTIRLWFEKWWRWTWSRLWISLIEIYLLFERIDQEIARVYQVFQFYRYWWLAPLRGGEERRRLKLSGNISSLPAYQTRLCSQQKPEANSFSIYIIHTLFSLYNQHWRKTLIRARSGLAFINIKLSVISNQIKINKLASSIDQHLHLNFYVYMVEG